VKFNVPEQKEQPSFYSVLLNKPISYQLLLLRELVP